MRRGVLVAGLVLVLAGCSSSEPGPSSAPYTSEGPTPTVPTTTALTSASGSGVTVVHVTDGDTIDVRFPDGHVDTVRLVGINTPEDGECLADEATARLAALVGSGPVRLERDHSDRDRYDRLLRHVLVDGRSVGAQLVAEGLAISRAYPPDTGRQDQLDAAQAQAEAAGVGQWAADACGPITHATVRVGAVRADPPGDESQTPNEEWIEVDNTGSVPVDLTGWGVKDESSSHRFTFPDGFRLAAGATVRLHTGCGTATATDLYWCVTGSAVWNNDGDTAFLTDRAGNVADQRPV